MSHPFANLRDITPHYSFIALKQQLSKQMGKGEVTRKDKGPCKLREKCVNGISFMTVPEFTELHYVNSLKNLVLVLLCNLNRQATKTESSYRT